MNSALDDSNTVAKSASERYNSNFVASIDLSARLFALTASTIALCSGVNAGGGDAPPTAAAALPPPKTGAEGLVVVVVVVVGECDAGLVVGAESDAPVVEEAAGLLAEDAIGDTDSGLVVVAGAAAGLEEV